MRELRVIGVESGGTHVICQDPGTGDKFRIASDERLRAAARGDISRLGQIEIEMESALRPREIQARIRAGATVAEVAAVAGVTPDKIERFAHPVLLERTRATELAGASHPIRHDGPGVATLTESVADALVAYGQNPQEAVWDAWKAEDNFWVVQVAWHIGRTDHAAHWRFHPGSHGGTADPLDDLADEMTHPEMIQPRRRLTPVATPDLTAPVEVGPARGEVTLDANSIIGAQRARQQRPALPDSDDHGTVALDFDLPPEPAVRELPRHDAAATGESDAREPAWSPTPEIDDPESVDPVIVEEAATSAADAETSDSVVADTSATRSSIIDTVAPNPTADTPAAPEPSAPETGAPETSAPETGAAEPVAPASVGDTAAHDSSSTGATTGAVPAQPTPFRSHTSPGAHRAEDRPDDTDRSAGHGRSGGGPASADTDPGRDPESVRPTPIAPRGTEAPGASSDRAAAQQDSTQQDSGQQDSRQQDSGPADKPRRRKSRKPAVPAWEDVLLGVRSNGGNS